MICYSVFGVGAGIYLLAQRRRAHKTWLEIRRSIPWIMVLFLCVACAPVTPVVKPDPTPVQPVENITNATVAPPPSSFAWDLTKDNLVLFPTLAGSQAAFFYEARTKTGVIVDTGYKEDATHIIKWLKDHDMFRAAKMVVTHNVPGRMDGAAYLTYGLKPEWFIDNGIGARPAISSTVGFEPLLADGPIIEDMRAEIMYEQGFVSVANDNSIVLVFGTNQVIYMSDCSDQCIPPDTRYRVIVLTHYGQCPTNSVETLLSQYPDYLVYNGKLCESLSETVQTLGVRALNQADGIIKIEMDGTVMNVQQYAGW